MVLACLLLTASGWAQRGHGEGTMAYDRIPGSRFVFEGVLGERIHANEANWLLRAPDDNPGLLGMFRTRDETPPPDLVPWAGEFVGKYLISCVQALRMSGPEELRRQTARSVRELIATQDADGYMGPFPKAVRLKANWDLWGHYHCMLALLMWHEETGDKEALAACRRVADLICRTYLHTGLRVKDAGSPEMNMAVIDGLGVLYRRTHEPRYLEMMHEIEKDWESAGDYLRTGLAGTPFYKTPRPRWESLHDLQGLVELYRITGDERYRQAFESHWRSIQRWDRHNTGAFSTGEGAIGNPYAPGPIETCCTVAWMAITVDMLRLTGDPRVADELELSTWNAGAGAQHPTGQWWTYDTPMDGTRIPSFKAIAFQARPTTPELNCCSVNGPRALGVLTEWAVMASEKGLAVNFYGPGSFTGKLHDGTAVTLRWKTDYPRSGRVLLEVETAHPHRFPLLLRIPAWSQATHAQVNKEAAPDPVPGTYLTLEREWRKGDTVTLDLDMSLRAVKGEHEQTGRVSLYRGPLLLAFDPHYNPAGESALHPIRLEAIEQSTVRIPERRPGADPDQEPWVLVSVPATEGGTVTLCDYASAGATGSAYRSWLPVEQAGVGR